MLFRSVYGYNNPFRASDWQAFAPDITSDRKSTSVGSRVIAQEGSNKFHPGTIVYIDPSYSNYKVGLDGGGYWYRPISQLRVLLPGFTGKPVFHDHLGSVHTHTLVRFLSFSFRNAFCFSFFFLDVCVFVVVFFLF